MIPTFMLSLILLGLSGLLIDSHRRGWHAADASTALSARDKRFALSQYRRRMQASSMIGVMGAAIAVWPIIPRQPGPMAMFMGALLAACGWIMMLALLDAWATRQHYRRLRDENLAAHVRLARELRASRDSADNDSWRSAHGESNNGP